MKKNICIFVAMVLMLMPTYAFAGAVTNGYVIDNEEDWAGLNSWITSTAADDDTITIKYASSNNRVIELGTKSLTIVQDSSIAESTLTNLRITSTSDVSLTIQNLNASWNASTVVGGLIDLAGESTLFFRGENALAVTGNATDRSAVIHVGADSALNGIQGLTLSGDTNDSLNVTSVNFGAAIGGHGLGSGAAEAGGNITITGGTVSTTAIYGAGIGGGYGGTIGGSGGEITISGGTVFTKSTYGAGIGGGRGTAGGSGGEITISGGTVSTTAINGAGIGGGEGGNTGGSGGEITISDGTVSTSAINGAGIGGGYGGTTGGSGGDIIIYDATLDATSKHGAGIGGGGGKTGGSGREIIISCGAVTTRSTDGAGIGGGGGDGNNIGGNGGIININDSIIETNSAMGTGIGGGQGRYGIGGNGGTVTIRGGDMETSVSGYYFSTNDIGAGNYNPDGGTLSISGGAKLKMNSYGTNADVTNSIGVCDIYDSKTNLTGIYRTLTVNGGTYETDHEQRGNWMEGIVKGGAAVTLTADTQGVGSWSAEPAVTFTDPTSPVTTFIMPEFSVKATANFVITPTITSDNTFAFITGEGGTFTVTATGTPAPTFSLSGQPAGVEIHPVTGVITIPTTLVAGDYSFSVTASNGTSPDATQSFILKGYIDTIPVSGVSLDKDGIYLTTGESETLTATILPVNAGNKNVAWSSSNESVATVDANGKVTAVGSGTAEIMVKTTDGNKTAVCVVSVIGTPAKSPATKEHLNYDLTSKTYSGKAQRVAVKPQNGVGNVTAIYYNGSKTVPKNAGSYTITADVAAGTQYNAVKGIKLGTFTINKANFSKVKVSISDIAWTGKKVKPKGFTYNGLNFSVKTNATVKKYGKNKKIGKGTVKITGKGNFTGTKTITFKIVPKKNKILNLSVKKKSIKVKWKKVSKAQKVTKYQVRYRIKGANSWITKTYSSKTSSATIKKLKKNKKYEIQARSYKKVSGKKYYSSWSVSKISRKVK